MHTNDYIFSPDSTGDSISGNHRHEQRVIVYEECLCSYDTYVLEIGLAPEKYVVPLESLVKACI